MLVTKTCSHATLFRAKEVTENRFSIFTFAIIQIIFFKDGFRKQIFLIIRYHELKFVACLKQINIPSIELYWNAC